MPVHQFSFDFDSKPIAEKEDNLKKEKEVIVAPPDEKLEPIVLVSEITSTKKNNKKLTRGRLSLKELDSGADLIEVPEDEVLFEKMYYPIGTVAEMFKVNQSLIRFWENEFDILKPKKNGKGDRLFRPEDVKNLKLIYHLLRERKYTLEGAKDFLKSNAKTKEKFELIESLKKLKGFLNELKANI